MIFRRTTRITPNMPAGMYKTYGIVSPLETHFRQVPCAEVDCAAQANGWRTSVDESTHEGQKRAHYIRRMSGRQFTERRDPTGLTVFEFGAGQTCFAQHRQPLERPAHFLVRDGDWRGNPRGTPTIELAAEEWVDDFANHQQRLADKFQQG